VHDASKLAQAAAANGSHEFDWEPAGPSSGETHQILQVVQHGRLAKYPTGKANRTPSARPLEPTLPETDQYVEGVAFTA
jgi:hypothetical protein